MRHLPSLRAIHAFDEAARHGNFTTAAQHLGVTQGAVSRQVQELERYLGIKLFIRSGPHLKLTGAGTQFAMKSTQALDILCAAVEAAKHSTGPDYVTISMLPSVAAKWLAPKLTAFAARHPDIDLRITASRQFVDFAIDGVDAAIRYGKGNWQGLNATLLATETITPVCAPRYARNHSLEDPADLFNATLLHADINEDWLQWFNMANLATANIPNQLLKRGPRLGDDGAILQAAIDGQGVALGRSLLIADDLASGRLVAPFSISLEASFQYWLVMPETTRPGKTLDAVTGWIKGQFIGALQDQGV